MTGVKVRGAPMMKREHVGETWMEVGEETKGEREKEEEQERLERK